MPCAVSQQPPHRSGLAQAGNRACLSTIRWAREGMLGRVRTAGGTNTAAAGVGAIATGASA